METLRLDGAISHNEARMVRRHTTTLLRSFLPAGLDAPLTPAVACGGNAEALARLLGTKDERGMPSIEIEGLKKELPKILQRDVPERMERYGVKKDRAEVMGIAALVLATVGGELGLRRLLVPGVGIREGLLLDLAEESLPSKAAHDQVLLAEARTFAARVGHDLTHGEHVRKIARALFDQLGAVHGLPEELAVVLDLGALLHDIGEVVNRRGHHKHGEYMLRWGRIPGLESPEREMVAALIRAHRKSPPDATRHATYAELPKEHRQEVCKLVALLRIADALDTDHRQRVTTLRASVRDRTVALDVRARQPTSEIAQKAMRKTDLFQSEFGFAVSCSVREELEAERAGPRAKAERASAVAE